MLRRTVALRRAADQLARASAQSMVERQPLPKAVIQIAENREIECPLSARSSRSASGA